MKSKPRVFPNDLGVLGLPGDVRPWDVRFDPGLRRHVERLQDGRIRVVVWTEPSLAEGWLVVRSSDGSVVGYPMEESGVSSRFIFHRIDLELPRAVEYSFAFRSVDGAAVYLVESGISGSVERLDRFSFDPQSRRASGTPDWVAGAVIYQIFPDRFANGDPSNDPDDVEAWGAPPRPRQFQGGDLAGVTEKLGYLSSLGVDVIYLNPVFSSPSNHRYDTVDYKSVDSGLGGDAALEQLVDAAHKRGLRVILDASFNHVHPRFFAFGDVIEKGKDSEFWGWFVVNEWPLKVRVRPSRSRGNEWKAVWAEQTGLPIEEVGTPGPEVEPTYDSWYSVPTMPRVDLSNPAARSYMLGVARHWVKRFDVDGWRMDVARYVDPDFWNDFRLAVRSVKPDAYLLAEIFGDVTPWLQGDRFDATMNYTFRSLAVAFFAKGTIDGVGFLDAATQLVHTYGWENTLANHNLLGSHDTPRFLTEAQGDVWRARLAMVFQLTFPGAPGIYYGDEVGLEGGEDPGCRGAFPWSDPAVESHPLGNAIREITRLRRRHLALRTGEWRAIGADGMAISYERRRGRSRMIVILNAGSSESEWMLPSARPLWGSARVEFDTVVIPGHSAAILAG